MFVCSSDTLMVLMRYRHPGLNFSCTQKWDEKFPHADAHLHTHTQTHTPAVVAWLGVRLAHEAGEVKSDPAVKVPQHAILTLPPSSPPLNPLCDGWTHTHPRHTHFLVMCQILSIRKNGKTAK